MPNAPVTGCKAGFRAAIDQFLLERLQSKLEKLRPDDPLRDNLVGSFQRDAWLANAAKRVEQIQAVTHSLKPIHPDARGTNLYVEPASLPPLQEVGSHVLGSAFTGDVVGNAAALDVYKLLKIEVKGRSLLAALLAEDEAAIQALHDDLEQAKSLRDAFVGLTQPRADRPSSHERAKQVYWLKAVMLALTTAMSCWLRCTPHRSRTPCMRKCRMIAMVRLTRRLARRGASANRMMAYFGITQI